METYKGLSKIKALFFCENEAKLTISLKDFRTPSFQISDYHDGQLVTRENFTDFLIESFAISRGDLRKQIVFFEWVQSKIGFNWEGTIINFLGAGGWACFNKQEKINFITAYTKVHDYISDAGWGEALRTQLDDIPKKTWRMTSKVTTLNEFKERYGELSTMSRKELVRNMNRWTPPIDMD